MTVVTLETDFDLDISSNKPIVRKLPKLNINHSILQNDYENLSKMP